MKNLLLPLESEPVHHKDLSSQKKTCDLALVQRNSKEIQGASPVHRRAGHVEWEAGDRSIHEDTKVVTQVGASHTKSPHAGQNQHRTDDKQDTADEWLVHWGVEGLLVKGDLVHMITQNAQREDCKCQEVASSVRSTEKASQDVVFVLCWGPWLAEMFEYR